MISDSATTCMLEPPGKIYPEMTGLIVRDEDHVAGLNCRRRPLSMAWISDELLAETIDVWSEAYGRSVEEKEAVEILMNVKRLGEVLLNAHREG